MAIQLTSYCVALWETPRAPTPWAHQPGHQAGWSGALRPGLRYECGPGLIFDRGHVHLPDILQARYEITWLAIANTARRRNQREKVTIRNGHLRAICGLAGFIAVPVPATPSPPPTAGAGLHAIIVAGWPSSCLCDDPYPVLLVFLQKGSIQNCLPVQSLNDYAPVIITGIILSSFSARVLINYVSSAGIKRGRGQKTTAQLIQLLQSSVAWQTSLCTAPSANFNGEIRQPKPASRAIMYWGIAGLAASLLL